MRKQVTGRWTKGLDNEHQIKEEEEEEEEEEE
jgi:hypothetical protein